MRFCKKCQKETGHWQNFVSNRDPQNWNRIYFNSYITYYCEECGTIYSTDMKKDLENVSN